MPSRSGGNTLSCQLSRTPLGREGASGKIQVEAGRAGGVKERRRVVGRAKNILCLRVAVVKKLQVRYGIPVMSHSLLSKDQSESGYQRGLGVNILDLSEVISFQSEPSKARPPRGVLTSQGRCQSTGLRILLTLVPRLLLLECLWGVHVSITGCLSPRNPNHR